MFICLDSATKPKSEAVGSSSEQLMVLMLAKMDKEAAERKAERAEEEKRRKTERAEEEKRRNQERKAETEDRRKEAELTRLLLEKLTRPPTTDVSTTSTPSASSAPKPAGSESSVSTARAVEPTEMSLMMQAVKTMCETATSLKEHTERQTQLLDAFSSRAVPHLVQSNLEPMYMVPAHQQQQALYLTGQSALQTRQQYQGQQFQGQGQGQYQYQGQGQSRSHFQ
jgi:hypothetical protein